MSQSIASRGGKLGGPRVAVVGGGPGGLTAAKSLREEGLEPTVFEQSDAVGGQWHTAAAHSGTWKGMRANTSRTLNGFSDFPMDDDLPMFPRAEQLQAYHAAYVEAFGFTDALRLGSTVVEVVADGNAYHVRWKKGARAGTETFDGVVVASGRYHCPGLPPIPGLDRFSGAGGVRHTFDYHGKQEFQGRRVVVLGNGISGLEVASDLAFDDTIETVAAFRKPRYIVPRVGLGVPSDWRFFTRAAAYLAQALPRAELGERVKHEVLRVAGHPSRYGAPAPDEDIFVANIGLCQHWLSHVAEGRLAVRPNIVEVDGSRVRFADGSSFEADAILCATGYDLSLPFLSQPILRQIGLQAKTLDLYHHTFRPELPGLAFAGLYHLRGPYAPVLELQGRWIAMVFAGVCQLPDEPAMRRGIADWQRARQSGYEIPMNQLALVFADAAGVAPLLDRRPEILRSLLFGPMAAAQFRLDGHGSRPEALDLFRKAAADFGRDTSPRPTNDELQLARLVAAELGDHRPELRRAVGILERLAASRPE